MKFVILDSINANFEIIILSESWIVLESTPINNFQINGYSTSKLNKSQNYIPSNFLLERHTNRNFSNRAKHACTNFSRNYV